MGAIRNLISKELERWIAEKDRRGGKMLSAEEIRELYSFMDNLEDFQLMYLLIFNFQFVESNLAIIVK